ncbi:MAG: UDP-N-acetylglucosamine diphosphorylase/glucosamine-1-phosphate N-acetyltransferase [Chloroflexi bacterium]|nr:MAG: UDP-N-acetylglucosamine diphosphorylase/glucosamine-1-phosphate N-acetyltransferase [Chloroflexota bacterium]
METNAVILAAGLGKRMRSKLPKVLHPLVGRPMVLYVLEAASAVIDKKPVVVVGFGREKVMQAIGDRALFAYQEEPLGTGDALLRARDLVAPPNSTVLVLNGDAPLIREETIRSLLETHQREKAALTFLTFRSDDCTGFGRVVRDAHGQVMKLVEEAEASEEERQITELNAGVYCFEGSWLWEHLKLLKPHPNGEYYLTDLVNIASGEGLPIATLTADEEEALGINTRVHLAKAEAIMRRRINQRWMERGVTIINPEATYIEATVEIGRDCVIYPNTFLQGKTSLGEDCRIGPNTIVRDSVIGNGCVVIASVIEGSILEDDVEVGPFSHLRPGAHLARGVHIGNFAEVKKSYLGPGTKMGHFSYLGDATVGAGVNIGAGTITCNFDGQRKHPTVIEDGAFIGSDTMLVAPVKVGAKAKTGAGSVVTRDIPPKALAYGVPARVKKLLEGEENPSEGRG